MTDKKHSVVFRGDIVIGKNLPKVKQKLKQIFKVNDARIDALFVGKPVPLKTNLSQQEAEKYKAILHQAGIVVSIESAEAKASKPPPVKKTQAASPSDQTDEPVKGNEGGEWKLAPVGSLLQDKKSQQTDEVDVNVEHLSVMPQEGNLLADSERQPEPQSTVDASALDWDLTPYGEALLKEAEKKTITPVDVDTASLSLAEDDGNLVKESERKKVEVQEVDTSHLQLVPEEPVSPEK